MNHFPAFSSRYIRIDRKDIDTDIIIPADFLKTTIKEGLGKNVFYSLRLNDPDFQMEHPDFKNAKILVAGSNFGCGSSREHAPWALKDAGIDVVIASSFADIFKGNAEKNGVLPVILQEEVVQKMLSPKNPLEEIFVDLESQIVRFEEREYAFSVADFVKKRFLEGMNDLDYLLYYAPDIRHFEAKRKEKIFGL